MGCIHETHTVLSQLNGFKVLVPGNHDRISRFYSPNHRAKNHTYYDSAFDVILAEKDVSITLPNGVMVNLSHYPATEPHWDFSQGGGDTFKDVRPVDNRTIIHGHTHQSEKLTVAPSGHKQIHVGVDAWDYTPVHVDHIMNIIDDV